MAINSTKHPGSLLTVQVHFQTKFTWSQEIRNIWVWLHQQWYCFQGRVNISHLISGLLAFQWIVNYGSRFAHQKAAVSHKTARKLHVLAFWDHQPRSHVNKSGDDVLSARFGLVVFSMVTSSCQVAKSNWRSFMCRLKRWLRFQGNWGFLRYSKNIKLNASTIYVNFNRLRRNRHKCRMFHDALFSGRQISSF